jgi:hypothetical protein
MFNTKSQGKFKAKKMLIFKPIPPIGEEIMANLRAFTQ